MSRLPVAQKTLTSALGLANFSIKLSQQDTTSSFKHTNAFGLCYPPCLIHLTAPNVCFCHETGLNAYPTHPLLQSSVYSTLITQPCLHLARLKRSMIQNYLTFLVFALMFICARLLTAKLPESILSGNEFENIKYGETLSVSSSNSICTQFVTCLLTHYGNRKGPVCGNKLVLIYLCSLLLAESYT